MVGQVFILRALPSAGKSELSKLLAEKFSPTPPLESNNATKIPVILSTDDFFVDKKTKKYEFDPTRIQEAHKWNFERFKKEVESGTETIIIDNTNIKKYHFYHYMDWAQRHDYKVYIITIPHNDVSDKELAERNLHGVDRDLIRRMRKDFEWRIHD